MNPVNSLTIRVSASFSQIAAMCEDSQIVGQVNTCRKYCLYVNVRAEQDM
jgi:hypothetical protein